MRVLRLSVFLAAAACASPAIAPHAPGPVPRVGVKSLRRAIDSVANSPELSNGQWGILVVTTTGDTLYSRNAGKLFMPASNQKIITAAIALSQLGPDYRYRTAFVAHGQITSGVLEGDLAVIGRGDPSVSDHMRGDAMIPLREIADSIVAKGIKRIRGKVIAEGNAFPDAVLGFGWSWDDLESDFAAPIDELLFNEGFALIVVRGGAQPGDSVRVETRPARTVPRLRVSAVTAASVTTVADSGRPVTPRPTITVRKDTLSGDVLIGGSIAPLDSAILTVTHRDPAGAFISALREALAEKGITIGDEALPVGPASDTLAVLGSPPLRDILPPFLKPSQNQIGEMLFKTLGLERGSAGTAAAGRQVVEDQLKTWGARESGFVVRDGSGLSRYDFLSPETILKVLDAVRRSEHFSAFYEAMPVAGVDGTIRGRMRGTPAESNARAKTGSFAQARALSGYVRTLTGDTLMFSILANNWNVPSGNVTRAVDSITARLASYRKR